MIHSSGWKRAGTIVYNDCATELIGFIIRALHNEQGSPWAYLIYFSVRSTRISFLISTDLRVNDMYNIQPIVWQLVNYAWFPCTSLL